jgi:hypothetical protein
LGAQKVSPEALMSGQQSEFAFESQYQMHSSVTQACRGVLLLDPSIEKKR